MTRRKWNESNGHVGEPLGAEVQEVGGGCRMAILFIGFWVVFVGLVWSLSLVASQMIGG